MQVGQVGGEVIPGCVVWTVFANIAGRLRQTSISFSIKQQTIAVNKQTDLYTHSHPHNTGLAYQRHGWSTRRRISFAQQTIRAFHLHTRRLCSAKIVECSAMQAACAVRSALSLARESCMSHAISSTLAGFAARCLTVRLDPCLTLCT